MPAYRVRWSMRFGVHATFLDIVNKITSEILQPALELLFVLAIVVFGYGVVRYLYGSQGSEQELTKAKWALFWGVVGMFVLVAFGGIVYLLCDFFGTCVKTGL